MILQHPNKILTTPCREVMFGTPLAREIGMRLMQEMEDNPRKSLGLSANQIGELWRVFAIDVKFFQLKTKSIWCNPVVTWESPETGVMIEECMSLPRATKIPVRRHLKIHVTAYTPSGKKFEVKLGGLAARCVQHELDHLGGVMILSRDERKLQRSLPMPQPSSSPCPCTVFP